VFKANPVKLNHHRYRTTPVLSSDMLVLLWSDLHFGLDVSSRDVFDNEFNWQIASRRMSKLCAEAAAQSNKKKKLRIYLNGDIIAGSIHLEDANLKLITEQIWGATCILTGAIDFLKQFFSEIEIACLPGNHDRTGHRTNSRQLSQRWDSYAHAIYLSLAQRFSRVKGISFDIPTTGFSVLNDAAGGLVVASHGDIEPEPGNVSKKIDTDSLQRKLRNLQDSGNLGRPITVALYGHWHTPTVQMLSNGSFVIVNGCLIGSDPYAQNALAIIGGTPAQVMFELNKDGLTNLRIVKVRDADDNKDFDSIIVPPKIFSNGQMVI
jgi:hypothetical protein